MRFDMSNVTTAGTSGISVRVGEPGGVPGGTITKKKPGKGSRPVASQVGGNRPWAPKSDVFVMKQPRRIKVPELPCPASGEMGIEGTVVLKVQLRRDGSVRRVKVSKGIGHGCDQVARRALKRARFQPAVGTDGKPVDYELRYEYEFRLND